MNKLQETAAALRTLGFDKQQIEFAIEHMEQTEIWMHSVSTLVEYSIALIAKEYKKGGE